MYLFSSISRKFVILIPGFARFPESELISELIIDSSARLRRQHES